MKITRRDLDQDILNKLDALDRVVDTFDENSPDGFVSYKTNGGFYFKKTNDTFLKRVFTEDEIIELESDLHTAKKNVKSSLLEDIRADGKYNEAEKSFMLKADFSATIDLPGKPVVVKEIDDEIVIVTDNGKLVVIKGSKIISSVDVVAIIKKDFMSASRITGNDICDIARNTDGVYVIGTRSSGSYKYYPEKGAVELLAATDGLRALDVGVNGNVFLFSDKISAQYDFESGKKIESYYNIVNSYQIPVKSHINKSGIFVIAAPTGLQKLDPILHLWKPDVANVNYNIADNTVSARVLDSSYQVLYAYLSNDTLYVSGKLGYDKAFVWKYDLATMGMSEDIIDCVDMTLYNGFTVVDGKYVVLSGKKIYSIVDNTIERNILLPARCEKLLPAESGVITFCGNKLLEIEFRSFNKKSEQLSFMVYENTEPCNNIDIFIKNASRAERVTLINCDTNKEIPASYYVVYDGNTIIKLMNCSATKIRMDIAVNDKTNLGGIVVKCNKIFLR